MARCLLLTMAFSFWFATNLSAQTLVHLWAFEGNYNDTSGSGNHGVQDGSPTFVAGKFGQAVSLSSSTFDGVHLNFGAQNLPLAANASWTINLWANFETPPAGLEYLAGFGVNDNYIAELDTSATRAVIAFGEPGGIGFYFWGGANDLASGVAYEADGQWHMYTVSYQYHEETESGSMFMYKNGTQVIGPVAKTFAQALDEVHVGNPSNWNSTFDGAIDEFAIFSGALSDSQIGGLYYNNDINQPVTVDPSITVDRATGQILFTNDSSFDIELLGYTIRSAVGALDATSWSTIAGRFDAPPGDGSIDGNDVWTVLTDTELNFSTELSEGVPGTDGGTIGTGKVIDFGNAWVPNPTEDVVIDLLLNDGQGTIKTIAASFIGNGDAPFLQGDFNGDGTIDVNDWELFRSANRADLTGATLTEAYHGGDLNGDFKKDLADYSRFAQRYDMFNGNGSFAALVSAQVPEPSAHWLIVLLLVGVVMRRQLRLVALSLAVGGAFLAMATPASADLWGYYQLNGNANESTGNNINLNLMGDASFGGSVHPGLGSALQLDGIGDGAIGENFNKITGNDMTGMAWVYANNLDGTWSSIVKNWGQQNGGQFHFGLGSGVSEDRLQNHIVGTSITAADPIPVGEWLHTAFVIDSAAGEQRLYLNGQLIQTADYEGTLAPGVATGLGIGVKPNDAGTALATASEGPWNGRIDDVALFNEVKTGDEILAIYQNGLQGIQVDGTTVPYIHLQVDRETGEVMLVNGTAGAVDINAYQVKSPDGALRIDHWANLAGNSGFPTGSGIGNGWEQDGASGSTQLLETYLSGNSVFGNGLTISLGEIFNPGGNETLEFSYRLADGSIVESIVHYVGVGPEGLLGDFNLDGVVDAADYTVWRNNLGQSDSVLNGNGDNTGPSMGVVDGADYEIWKSNFGAQSGVPLQSPAAIPEPSSALVLVVAGGALIALRRRGSIPLA